MNDFSVRRCCLGLMISMALMAALAAPAAGKQTLLRITEIRDLGRLVTLQDGSIWKVTDSDDQDKVYRNWLVAQEVVVKGLKTLVNLHTGDQIEARRIQAPTREVVPGALPAPAPQRSAALPPARTIAPQLGKIRARLDEMARGLEGLNLRLNALEMRMRQLEGRLKKGKP